MFVSASTRVIALSTLNTVSVWLLLLLLCVMCLCGIVCCALLCYSSLLLSLSLSVGSPLSFPSHPASLLRLSVGRVLTRSPLSPTGPFVFSGQCVSLTPRLLFTAAHVCFDPHMKSSDRNSHLQLKVLLMKEKGKVEEYDAIPIRYSGKMDIAILQLIQPHSAFHPLPLADATGINADMSDMPCGLVAFDLASDGEALRRDGTQAEVEVDIVGLQTLPHIPQWFRSHICSVREVLLGKRYFLKSRSEYKNEKGLSGGAVVGMQQGRLVLFGIHICNERLAFNEQLSYIAGKLMVGENNGEGEEKAQQEEEEETKMSDIPVAAQVVPSSAPSSSLPVSAGDSGGTNSRDSRSGSIADPPMKTVKDLADNICNTMLVQ